MDESFNFLLFSHVLGVKNGMPILFPRNFWLLICGSTRQIKYFFISKSEKHLETRLHRPKTIKSKTKEKLACLQKACEKKVFEFKVSELFTSFLISSPESLVFTIVLMTMRVFFVVNTTRKARDPGILSYQLTGSS